MTTMKAATNKSLPCDALWNERQAHFAMQQDVEQNKQDDLRAMNKKTIDDEQTANSQ